VINLANNSIVNCGFKFDKSGVTLSNTLLVGNKGCFLKLTYYASLHYSIVLHFGTLAFVIAFFVGVGYNLKSSILLGVLP